MRIQGPEAGEMRADGKLRVCKCVQDTHEEHGCSFWSRSLTTLVEEFDWVL